MAVYTNLDENTIQQIMGVYSGIGDLVKYTGLSAGSINTNYRIEMTAGVYYLRIAENKTLTDLIFEKRVLQHLETQAEKLSGISAPRILKNSIGGHFFLLENKKYAMLFPELRGRELGVFELEGGHLFQLGAHLARVHGVLLSLPRKRRNPYGVPVMLRWLEELNRRFVDKEVLDRLQAQFLKVVKRREKKRLPIGLIHGDLFMNNTKWYRGNLDAVFDWEMAGRDFLALDIAIGLNAWCWKRKPIPDQGFFEADLCRSFVEGYQSVRQLHRSEKTQIFNETRLAAFRFTFSRIRDFELPYREARDEAGDAAKPSTAQRDHLDYRDFEHRLNCWTGLGDGGFRAMIGIKDGQYKIAKASLPR